MEPTIVSRNHRKRWYKFTKAATISTPIRKSQEPGYKIQIDGEAQTQARVRGIRNQEKESPVVKSMYST